MRDAFAGATYEPRYDDKRLTSQLDRIVSLMLDGQWRTLEEISRATGDGAASVSAQLRNARKQAHGGYVVEKRIRGERAAGLYEYRLLPGIPAGRLF